MATPPTAQAFDQTLDPHEELDFLIDCSSLLDGGEKIASYTLTLYAESIAHGLEIMSGGGRDDALANDSTAILLWFEISDPDETDVDFDGAGVSLPVDLVFVTNSTPARTRNRTFLVKVAQL